MNITSITIAPFGRSFEPEFHITVGVYSKNNFIMPIKCNGFLFLDLMRFSFLHEYQFDDNTDESFYCQKDSRKVDYQKELIFLAPFSQLALSKLEEKRSQNVKGDLEFDLILYIEYLDPIHNWENTQTGNNQFVTNDHTSLFVKRRRTFREKLKISGSDWVHDYCSAFNNTKYHVFEIPVPNLLNGSKKINQILQGSINSLAAMEDAKREGDWNAVIKESRPVWELTQKKDEIDALLRSDNLDETTIESFNKVLESLFDFSSKFIHKVSKGTDKKIMKANNASKEDAELIYSMSFSIVNLISKKIAE
jgi:hypothetical protein